MSENKKNNHLDSGLYVVSTPIGNLSDIKKLVSFHKFNETKKCQEVFDDIEGGKIISLISDAGTPLISDPGEFLIKLARKKKIKVIPIPGPSAVTAAISVAGFSSKFFFYGFLSKKTKERIRELESLSKIDSSIVLYLPARDLKKSLEEFKIYFENRMVFVAREITKLHETYLSGTAEELLENIGANDLKGEITVVISDKSADLENAEDVNLVYEINLLINKMSSKDIVEYLAKKLKISKKIIYQNILDLEK